MSLDSYNKFEKFCGENHLQIISQNYKNKLYSINTQLEFRCELKEHEFISTIANVYKDKCIGCVKDEHDRIQKEYEEKQNKQKQKRIKAESILMKLNSDNLEEIKERIPSFTIHNCVSPNELSDLSEQMCINHYVTFTILDDEGNKIEYKRAISNKHVKMLCSEFGVDLPYCMNEDNYERINGNDGKTYKVKKGGEWPKYIGSGTMSAFGSTSMWIRENGEVFVNTYH